MVEKAKEFVKKCMTGDTSGHDWFHVLRVLRLAESIALEEQKRQKVDLQTVQLIALLHDVDDRKLSPDTYENLNRARKFLKENGANNFWMQIILCGISQISYKGIDSVVPESVEACIVQDADRLDAMGAIGIGRAFAFGGSRGRAMYDPSQAPQLNMDGEAYAQNKGNTINHFYEKLLLLKDMMNTEAGKQMALHRHAYMEAFLAEFYAEWDGIC